MTKVKMCGLSRMEDIEYANEVLPEFIGFVFAPKSRRYVSFEQAKKLRGELDYRIAAVGVFVDEDIENIVRLVKDEVIDMVQLHGSEDNAYIAKLREMAEVPIIQAFKIIDSYDAESAVLSDADFVLLDSGMGTGKTFDWSLIKSINRPYFLAGGISPENAAQAVERFSPYAVDASSSLETDGVKDLSKMTALARAVRE
ncbi:MAG: phosphoribosylanthranilate isomerase [Ruminococcus sp.]|nr:phosphoribosylanthranilate isomerase [Ruminococcus sp.]